MILNKSLLKKVIRIVVEKEFIVYQKKKTVNTLKYDAQCDFSSKTFTFIYKK